MKWADEDRRDRQALQAGIARLEQALVTARTTEATVAGVGDGADAERDRRLAAGLEATRRRLDLPPYPTREEWCLLVEYLATEEPSVFVDRIRAAITAHLDTLVQADTVQAQLDRILKLAKVLKLEDILQQGDRQRDSELVTLLKNFELVAAAQVRADQAEASLTAICTKKSCERRRVVISPRKNGRRILTSERRIDD